MIRLPYLFDDVNDNENDNTTINNNVNNNDHNQQQHSLDSLNCQQLHQEGLILQNASDLHQFNSMFQNNNDDNHLLFPDPTATISSLNDDYSSIQVLQNTRNVGLNSSATQSHLFNMGVSLHINNNRNRDNIEQSQITNNNNNNDDDNDDDDDKIKSPTTISSSYLQQQNPTLTQLLAAGTNNTKEVSLNPTSVTQNQQINGIIVDKQHQQQHVYPSVTTTNLPNLVNQKPPVYTKWTEKEDELLREAVQIYGPHKWSLIATHVPNRTPMQCSARWVGALNPSILKGRWTTQEDNALRDAVNQYMMNSVDSQGNPQPIPWNKVSKCIPARTGAQCQARWTEALDPRIKKGKWSPEEDEILKEGVRLYGRCWIRIAEMIAGRTQRQCRTRWLQVKNKQFKKKNNDSSNNNNNNKSNNNGPTAIIRTSSNKSDNNKNNANSNNSINNDNNSNDQKIILTPPNTTPSTPSQSIKNVILSSSRSSSVSSSLTSSPVSSSSPSSFSPTSNIQGVIMRSSPTNIHHSNNASNANNMTVQQHQQQQLLMINNRITSNSQTPRIVNEQLCNFIYPYHQINNHHQYNQLCNYSNNQISFY